MLGNMNGPIVATILPLKRESRDLVLADGLEIRQYDDDSLKITYAPAGHAYEAYQGRVLNDPNSAVYASIYEMVGPFMSTSGGNETSVVLADDGGSQRWGWILGGLALLGALGIFFWGGGPKKNPRRKRRRVTRRSRR